MVNNSCEKEKYEDYRKYKPKLSGEYKDTFEKIELYIMDSRKLGILSKDSCLMQIIDSLLCAQEQGTPIKQVTGRDFRRYCENMIHGESIYIYKASRICFTLFGAMAYVCYIYYFISIGTKIISGTGGVKLHPMNFGIGEVALMVAWIFTPKVVSMITEKYFEAPKQYKKVRRYASNGIVVITMIIYVFLRELAPEYVVVIPLQSVILILIYSTVICFSVWLMSINEIDSEKKHLEGFNKLYEKHMAKCHKGGKKPLEWNDFLKRNVRSNTFFFSLFFLYAVVFIVFSVLLGRGMLLEAGLDGFGIMIFIICAILAVFLFLVACEGFKRNRVLIRKRLE